MMPDEIEQIWIRLSNSAATLNDLMDKYRAAVQSIVGCDISEWPFETVEQCGELVLEQQRLLAASRRADMTPLLMLNEEANP